MTLSTKPTDRARRLAKFWKQMRVVLPSFGRGKRQSPIRLRGISSGSVNVCLHSFQQNSVATAG